ncbi:hypothetical protein EIP86_009766 [Pleurotus ostreatoroseus]|nr:hypothetical protein EIP86_009766 [Pleurotus ostreatoroseus]
MDFKHQGVRKLKLDVVDGEEVQRIVKAIINDENKIDILVNNAGTNCAGALLDIPEEAINRTFDINTYAALRLAKAVFPHMAARKRGTIINIGSLAEHIPTPWNGIYSASKAAVRSISDVLWQELKPFNISVIHVSAGQVRSNIAKNALSAGIHMSDDSLYKPFADVITQRISFSQSATAMQTEEFARRIVAASLRPHPPRNIWLGGMSWMFWFMTWLPRTWMLSYLWTLFCKIRNK